MFDHINKDRRARAKKGLAPRVRKNSGSGDMPEFIYIDDTIGLNKRSKV